MVRIWLAVVCALVAFRCNNLAELKLPKRRFGLSATRDANNQLVWRKVKIENNSPYSGVMLTYDLAGNLIDRDESVGSSGESFSYKNGEFQTYQRILKDAHCTTLRELTTESEREIRFCPTHPVAETYENKKTQEKRICIAIGQTYRCEEYKGNLLVKSREQQVPSTDSPWREFTYTSFGFIQSDFKTILREDTPESQFKDFYRMDTHYDLQGKQLSQSPWKFDGKLEESAPGSFSEFWTYYDKNGDLEYHYSRQTSL